MELREHQRGLLAALPASAPDCFFHLAPRLAPRLFHSNAMA